MSWGILLLAFLAATGAAAQESGGPRPCGETPGAAHVRFDNHLTLCLGTLLKAELLGKFQFDWKDVEAAPDVPTFDVHRSRVGTRGVILGRIEYEIERELSDPERPWRDVFVNVPVSRALEFRGGRFKVPFGAEQLISALDLDLAYRSAASSYLTPGREVGVSVHGRLRGKVTRYEAGVFRDGGDNVRRSESEDPRHATTLAARITVSPWKRQDTPPALKALTFGGGLSSGRLPEGPYALHAQTLADEPIFPRVYVNGRRHRLGADVEWRRGPVAARAEHLRVRDERRGQGTDENDLPEVRADGGYLAGSWVITGEKNDGDIAPTRPLLRGGPGAIELAARVEWLSFGSASTEPASSSPRAPHVRREGHRAVWLGVNWYLNRFARLQTNVVRAERRQGNAPLTGSDRWAMIFRLQLGL